MQKLFLSQTLTYTHISVLCAFHFVLLFIEASNLEHYKPALSFGDLGVLKHIS